MCRRRPRPSPPPPAVPTPRGAAAGRGGAHGQLGRVPRTRTASVPCMTTADATDSSGASPRFAAALSELGLDDLHTRIRRFPDATRTAAEAAAAIGCELSEICKSLIFAADGVPGL